GDLTGGHDDETPTCAMILSAGAFHRELADVQRLAVVPVDNPKIAYAPKVPHVQRRVADQFTDHPGIGKHAVVVTWNQSAGGNGADGRQPRLAVARRCEEDIAWGDRHPAAGHRL